MAEREDDAKLHEASGEFGARLDNQKTRDDITEGEIGVIKRLPHGKEWQLIVQRAPVPVKIAAGVVVIGGVVFGAYHLVMHEIRRREKEQWEENRKIKK